MALIATREDYEPANPTEGASALYYNPADGSGYTEYPFFQERVDALIGRFAPNGQKLAIFGCGFGYLVKLAVEAGYNAFGFDASSYAINRGKALLPTVANRLFVRDATTSAGVNGAKSDAGLKGQQKFPLLVTEDMLTCLTDAEIAVALPLLRGACSSNLLHIVMLEDPSTEQDPRVNWKTAAEWKAILSPPDVVANELGVVV